MQGRLLWGLLATVLLVFAIAGLRSCRQDPVIAAAVIPPVPDTTSTAPTPEAASDVEAAKLRARIRQHDDALYAAVAALQQYLAALGGGDRAKADAFWVDKRPPIDSHEADLRELKNLRGLRIENGRPKPLDSDPVPTALEIPVELRVGVEGSPLRRYRGWYRLRRAVADGRWEISSASIDAVKRAE
ncbi:hypothetical protein [Luteimonas mephitis]|jgi:hypothetical protein|uniref:hypothetical protein n=1 Tax=Luteimonas mephitis TaxID=83615 RepID=UPI0012EB0CEA|nr:hypothetical protein [Luteimonas mephitis]